MTTEERIKALEHQVQTLHQLLQHVDSAHSGRIEALEKLVKSNEGSLVDLCKGFRNHGHTP